MTMLTKYGAVQGYPILQTGRVFFVSPAAGYLLNGDTYSASDDNDGLSPERALRTISRSIVLATAAAGDVIVLLEGTHTVTEAISVSKAGLSFYGVGKYDEKFNVWNPKTVVTSTGTNTNLFNITADNCEIAYCKLRPTTAYSAVITTGTSNVDGIYVHDCYFDLVTPAVSLGTSGIDLTTRASATASPIGVKGFTGGATVYATAYIKANVFVADGAQGPAVWLASCYAYVQDNIFQNDGGGTWASPFVIATASRVVTIRDNVWIAAGIMGCCIDGTFAVSYKNTVAIFDNVFPINMTIATAFGPIRGFVDTSTAGMARNIILDGNSTGVTASRSVG